MERRQVVAGVLGAVVGGGVAARLQRVDILFRRRMWRARGEEVTLRVKRDVPESDKNGDTDLSTGRWVKLETKDVASKQVFSVIEDRLGEAPAGIGSGVAALVFGPVVTVARRTTYNRDGERIGSPEIGRQRLLNVVPRTIRVVIETSEDEHSRKFPVAVSDTVGHLQ